MTASDRILKLIASPDGQHRVLIVQRADGAYSFRRQWLEELNEGVEWGPPGPYAGVYDSPETAEREALACVKWPLGS
jgi:hypothetical protein